MILTFLEYMNRFNYCYHHRRWAIPVNAMMTMMMFLLLWNIMMIGSWSICNALSVSSSSSSGINKHKLKLISFDLDDTLFPITETLEDANRVMIERIVEDFGDAASSISNESIREATVSIRRSLSAPITYSELRTRAIESELKRCCCVSVSASTRVTAEAVFEAW